MNGVRALVLSVTAAALVAGGLVSPGVAWADAPTTVPTITSPVGVGPFTGVVTFSVTTSAPRVRFVAEGVELGHAAAVGSVASVEWSTWGFGNARPIDISAYDCDAADVCNTDAAATIVTLDNAVPVLTSPAPGATLSGLVTFTATSVGGAVVFYIDDPSRAENALTVKDETPPYEVTFDMADFGDNLHYVRAIMCPVGTDYCGGPQTNGVSFTATSSHPVVVSQLPSAFSPDANGVADTSTTTYSLPAAASVTWSVVDATGAVVRGPISLGSQTAGTHARVWDGKDNSAVRVADGLYTVVVRTEKSGVFGRATKTVVVDTTRPTLTVPTGGATAFYPYPDSYRDTFTPITTVSERVTLTLTVRNAANALVRRIGATRGPGSAGIAWNGRNTAGTLVPAGTYRWTLTAIDAAGNARVTAVYTTIVSLKKLVAKTVYVQLTPSKRIAMKRSASCAAVRTSTYGSTGAWFYNNCDVRKTGQQWVEDWFSTALPSAISYSTITLQVFGHTHSHAGYNPVARTYAWIDRVGGATWVTKKVDFRYSTARWVSLVAAPGAGFVSSTRRVAFGFGVDNYWYPAPNEVDVRYLRLVVVLKVLV